jgi:hypothetical protein
MAKLLVNWYKPSGKWYAQTELEVPDDFAITYDKDVLKEFIEEHQDQLDSNWVNGRWYVSVSCIEQTDEDPRFFERLFIYN